MTSPPAEDPLLERLRAATRDEYEIVRELGRGGFAAVYLARDVALDRDVAIKVLTPQARPDDPDVQAEVERFRREARTVARLNHPHVIPVYAVRTTDQLQYFVMKFIRGRALDGVLATTGKLPLALVQTILQQAGGALAYAHKHGVVHRDIKPANIMLDEEGWAVVADFGIAKVARAEKLTATGLIIGTAAYMSPEQWAGQDVTGLSDEYSLGVVAYELLTGRPPFAAESVTALLWAHLNEVPAPITDLRPDCPEEMDRIVRRMLEKEPAARFRSMEEVVAAIAALPVQEAPEATRTQLISLATVSRDSARAVAAASAGEDAASGATTPVMPSGKVARLTVNPPAADLAAGASLRLQASVLNSTGRQLARRVLAWRSLDERVATVDADGVVTARAAGGTSIVVNCEGAEASVLVTVTGKSTGVVAQGRSHAARLIAGTLIALFGVTGVLWQQGLLADLGTISRDGALDSANDTGGQDALGTPVKNAVRDGAAQGDTSTKVFGPTGRTATPGPDDSKLPEKAPFVQIANQDPTGRDPRTAEGTVASAPIPTASRPQPIGALTTAPVTASGNPATNPATIPATRPANADSGGPGGAPNADDDARAANGAVEISAGASETCAASADGARVLCWGGAAPAGSVIRESYFNKLAVGGGHICGITPDGVAHCWGDNSQGQLGDGTKQSRTTPTPVKATVRFVDISVGAAHTCALGADGTAWCWGANKFGQLGDNSLNERNRPVQVRGREAFRSLSAGGSHTCGVRGEKVYCWGDGFSGQIGNAMQESQREPFPVRTDVAFRSVVTGDRHTCALSSRGRAYCWGDNTSSQLGNDTRDDRNVPDSVATDLVFTRLAAGAKHSCGITSTRALACWGENSSGQLGDGTRQKRQLPTIVSRGSQWKQVSAGAAHTCGILRNDAVSCWGLNTRGQVGTGATGPIQPTPTVIKIGDRGGS